MRGAGSEWARRRGVVYRHKVWGRRSDHYCGFQRPKSAVHIIPRMLGCGPSNRPFSANVYLGRVDKRGSQGALMVIQAGICDGDQLGTRPDVGRGMGVS